MDNNDPISRFYLQNLPGAEITNSLIRTPCPFCSDEDEDKKKQLVVFLNQESFFHGYFRCLAHCRPGGFPLYFARLKVIEPSSTPGYDPDRLYAHSAADYPPKNINNDIIEYSERITDELYERYKSIGISPETLTEMRIGYNGRYLVYPYFQEDGNCYSARCVHPGRPEDLFWHGDETFSTGPFKIFNSAEIERCENGTLFIVEGEDNLLTLKQLGLPGIGVASASDLTELKAERLAWIRTLFLCVNKNPDSDNAARELATRMGFKVRLIRWPDTAPKNYCLSKMAAEEKKNFGKKVFQLIKEAKAFSPFPSPAKEFISFNEQLNLQGGDEYKSMLSGFPALDKALGGIHGINIVGGTPKTGKSCFLIQVAAEMARNKVPVLYYDFENGRQKIYQRTLSRICRLSVEELRSENLPPEKQQQLVTGMEELRKTLPWFRVITDRHVTPEIMRRHIDFLRHETNNQYTMVVIDSLHKLPFKDFSERRTGIDAWLRQLEAIRDELNVSFLVISELSRGKEGHYDSQPHLGSFKASGDIEYSSDNAMVLLPEWDSFSDTPMEQRVNSLWLVASREQSPGKVASYQLDYPYWGFTEK